jgi:hypothetical protein
VPGLTSHFSLRIYTMQLMPSPFSTRELSALMTDGANARIWVLGFLSTFWIYCYLSVLLGINSHRSGHIENGSMTSVHLQKVSQYQLTRIVPTATPTPIYGYLSSAQPIIRFIKHVKLLTSQSNVHPSLSRQCGSSLQAGEQKRHLQIPPAFRLFQRALFTSVSQNFPTSEAVYCQLTDHPSSSHYCNHSR